MKRRPSSRCAGPCACCRCRVSPSTASTTAAPAGSVPACRPVGVARPSNTTSGASAPSAESVADTAWKRCVTASEPPAVHHSPPTRAGTRHRCTVDRFSRPMALSGTSSVMLRSGCHSPMSQSWLTMRVPGASASRRGRSCRLNSGSRYIVITWACARSVRNRSCSRNSARSATPAARALSRLLRTSSGEISTPRPRAPKRRAAVMTMRPSPEPRSTTTSRAVTPASSSIASVTWSGVVMKGTSSCAVAGDGASQDAASAAEAVSAASARIGAMWGAASGGGRAFCDSPPRRRPGRLRGQCRLYRSQDHR